MAQANRHHGVTTTESTEGVRYISDISTAVIGMVCTADDADTAAFPLNKPVFYASAAEVIGKAGNKGTLAKSLDGIIDQADAQIVISAVETLGYGESRAGGGMAVDRPHLLGKSHPQLCLFAHRHDAPAGQ